MRTDDSLHYHVDFEIEALVRGAIGATLGSVLGVGLGFSPLVSPLLGRDAGVLPAGILMAGFIGISSVVGAMCYLRHR
jgi:hypothetical protein